MSTSQQYPFELGDNALSALMAPSDMHFTLPACSKCNQQKLDVEVDIFSGQVGFCATCKLEWDGSDDSTRAAEQKQYNNQDYSNASLCDENAYPELFSFLSNLPTKNIDTRDTLEASTIPKNTQVFPTLPSPVQTFCTAHSFSDLIAMTADDIHSRARDTAVKYAHQPNVLIAAAVYIACRHIGDPRTYKDIWTCAQISHRKLVNAVGYLETFLAAQDRNEREGGGEKRKGKEEANESGDKKGLFTHADLLYLYFSPLDLHPTVQAVCLDLSRRVAHYQLDSKRSPAAVASAIIFFICKLFDIPMSVYELSVLSGVSQWMIRNMFEAFRSEAGWRMLVDSRWLVDGTGSLERVLAWKPRKLGAKESRVA